MTKGEDKITGVLRNEIDDSGDITGDTFIEGGLTKREYFAGLALQGVIGGRQMALDYIDRKYIAESVKFADWLIEELNKEKK